MVSSIRDSSDKGFGTAGRRGVESSPSLRMFETLTMEIEGEPAARFWCVDGENQRSGGRGADRVRFDSAVHEAPRDWSSSRSSSRATARSASARASCIRDYSVSLDALGRVGDGVIERVPGWSAPHFNVSTSRRARSAGVSALATA